jgi:hypothetical protein
MKTQKFNLISLLNQELKELNIQSYVLHRIVLVIFILFLVVFNSQSQQLQELGKMLSTMTDNSEVGRIESLISDLQPSVYINNDEVKAFGDASPVCANVEASALAQLSLINPLFSSVELITIRIDKASDLSATIDLSTLTGFTNLKYVHILCTINCTASQLSNIVKGSNAGIVIFYQISIPS